MRENGANRMWKLVLAYDGTEFHGWQFQPGLVTIQGELRAAIERVTGENALPQGSGRTDTGVHALGQVASFALSAPIPEANLVRALNRTLPAAIRVLSAQMASHDFHARHSAKAKTYEYRIFRGEICPPWLARYAYALNHPLDLATMQGAALRVLGEHDFTSFAASDPEKMRRAAEPPAAVMSDGQWEPGNNLRTIHHSEWIAPPLAQAPDLTQAGQAPPGIDFHDVPLLIYRVRGNGFLHHMVRNLVGTFLQVGRGNMTEHDIPRILSARARAQAGPTAPARGLLLASVDY